MDIFPLYVVLFVVGCYIMYNLLYPKTYYFMEGLTMPDSSLSASSSSNGIAGNAAAYAANIKLLSVKSQDALLITKYRTDYENAVINVDDLVSNLMLEATLSIDSSKPQEALDKLVALNNAKAALNNVMKFIDKSK